jgi:hypothetical protein
MRLPTPSSGAPMHTEDGTPRRQQMELTALRGAARLAAIVEADKDSYERAKGGASCRERRSASFGSRHGPRWQR